MYCFKESNRTLLWNNKYRFIFAYKQIVCQKPLGSRSLHESICNVCFVWHGMHEHYPVSFVYIQGHSQKMLVAATVRHNDTMFLKRKHIRHVQTLVKCKLKQAHTNSKEETIKNMKKCSSTEVGWFWLRHCILWVSNKDQFSRLVYPSICKQISNLWTILKGLHYI